MKQNSILAYNRQIDGLRCIAVVCVLICHFIPFENYYLARLPFGQGVNLFFVLSGYLITKILLINKTQIADGSSNLKKVLSSFYWRRSLRIFPIYYLSLFYLRYIDFQNTKELWPWLVSYTTNIYQSLDKPYIGSFNHLWSLAVEEQFYLFWPFLLLFVPLKHIEKLIVGMVASALLFKGVYYYTYGHSGALNAFTLSCSDSLGFGALIAYWSLYREALYEKIARLWYTVPLSFLLFAYFMIYPASNLDLILVGNNFIYSIFAFFVVLRASRSKFTGVAAFLLEHPIAIYIGKISYGIYLYHFFMPDFYNQMTDFYPELFPVNGAIRRTFLFVSSFAFATVSWYLIERPFVYLKKYFSYTTK